MGLSFGFWVVSYCHALYNRLILNWSSFDLVEFRLANELKAI